MSSIRLNEGMRDQILANAMHGKFKTDELRHQVAKRVYALVQKIFKKEKTQFEKLIPSTPRLIHSGSTSLELIGKRVKGERTKSMIVYIGNLLDYSLVPNRTRDNCDDVEATKKAIQERLFEGKLEAHTIGNPHILGPRLIDLNKLNLTVKLQAEANSILEEHEKIREKEKARDTLKCQLNAVLNSVNTTNQLLEVWPEADQYMPIQTGVGRAMCVRIEELNNLMKAGDK